MSEEEGNHMNVPIYEFKVNIQCCEACRKKVKKLLKKTEGVCDVIVDGDEGKVTVAGIVDPNILLKTIAKVKKHVELLPPNPGDKQEDGGEPEADGGDDEGGSDEESSSNSEDQLLPPKPGKEKRPQREKAQKKNGGGRKNKSYSDYKNYNYDRMYQHMEYPQHPQGYPHYDRMYPWTPPPQPPHRERCTNCFNDDNANGCAIS